MNALEKDRVRRYETADGFTADLLRYLSGEAVQAHPPTTAYELKKFVRRNRPQVIAARWIFFGARGRGHRHDVGTDRGQAAGTDRAGHGGGRAANRTKRPGGIKNSTPGKPNTRWRRRSRDTAGSK